MRAIVKALPLLQLLGSGIFMTLVGLGQADAPDAFVYIHGDSTQANKFEWAQKLLVVFSIPQIFLLFGVCKFAAGVSWLTGKLELLSTICVLAMYGGITWCHIELGDDLMPMPVLIGLTLAKLLLGPAPAVKSVKTK
jgi:hypothetical protein